MMNTPVQVQAVYADVLYPWRRGNIIYYLSEFSNKNYQVREWTKKNTGFWEEAWWNIEELDCDCEADFEIFEHSMKSVFVSLDEAEILYKINVIVDKIMSSIGGRKEASAYLTSPLWDELVACAKEALEIFLKNEEEAKKTCVYPWHCGEDPDEWAKKKTEKLKELEASQNEPPPS